MKLGEEIKYRCLYCRRVSFDTLAELSKHLSRKHGLNDRKRRRIYKRMGIEE